MLADLGGAQLSTWLQAAGSVGHGYSTDVHSGAQGEGMIDIVIQGKLSHGDGRTQDGK